jgi:hypothetical protein
MNIKQISAAELEEKNIPDDDNNSWWPTHYIGTFRPPTRKVLRFSKSVVEILQTTCMRGNTVACGGHFGLAA